MHVFRVLNIGFVFEDTGNNCVGEHATRAIGLCRKEGYIVGQSEESEDRLI